MRRIFQTVVLLVTVGIVGLTFAKLPPLTDEQKAKAEEGKAKTAEGAKKEAELLVKAQDRVAEHFRKSRPPNVAQPPAKK